MSVKDTIELMLQAGMLILALLTFVVVLIKSIEK